MQEKRAHKRSPIELAASFGIPEDSLVMQQAKVIDASFFGFCFISEEEMKVGKKVQLALELTKEDTAVLLVQIMWQDFNEATQKYKVGVEIQDTQSPHYQKFVQFFQQKTE